VDLNNHDSFFHEELESDILANINSNISEVEDLEAEFSSDFNAISNELATLDTTLDTPSQDERHENNAYLRGERSEDPPLEHVQDERSELASLEHVQNKRSEEDVSLQGDRSENLSLPDERSEDDQPSLYNLRNNPSRRANSAFNSKSYAYIFLQYAQTVSESVSNIV